MNIREKFHNCYRVFLNLLFPKFCISCKKWLGLSEEVESRYICENCEKSIEYIERKDDFCKICHLYLPVGVSGICSECEKLNPYFDEGFSLFWLKGPGKEIVHQIKYNRGRYLLHDLMNILKKNTSLLEFCKNSILVPVPLHLKRERARGFNQSLWIAKAISLVNKNSVVSDFLVRTKETRTQTGLNKFQRKNNVLNAFALKKEINLDKSCKYILVDDVYTTGNTLNSCAKVLFSVGIRKISVLTLARGKYVIF